MFTFEIPSLSPEDADRILQRIEKIDRTACKHTVTIFSFTYDRLCRIIEDEYKQIQYEQREN